MFKILFLTLTSLLSLPAFATVDARDLVYIVARNIQSDEFYLERVPIIGCFGLPQGPRLQQFLRVYKVPTNIGCGETPVSYNINELKCAHLISAVESKDFLSFSAITLDISQCQAKSDPKFITMIRTAAARNFPQSNGKEVRLKLYK